jgi:3-deoxy-7-phosphoheptulonate synthase
MIVTLKSGAKKSDVQAVVARIKKLGFTPQLSRGAERVVIGVIGEGNKAIAHKDLFESMPQVEVVTPISKPYKVVSRVFKKTDTVIDVHGVPVGGKQIVVMAGPCSVDTRDNVMVTAKELKKAGVQVLRGGAFKPRTSPYAFQGLGEEALKYMAEARRATGCRSSRKSWTRARWIWWNATPTFCKSAPATPKITICCGKWAVRANPPC